VSPKLETEGQHTQTQTSTPKLNFIRVLKNSLAQRGKALAIWNGLFSVVAYHPVCGRRMSRVLQIEKFKNAKP
jgi:hypothetical protein